jgi:hypothetical protein
MRGRENLRNTTAVARKEFDCREIGTVSPTSFGTNLQGVAAFRTTQAGGDYRIPVFSLLSAQALGV